MKDKNLRIVTNTKIIDLEERIKKLEDLHIKELKNKVKEIDNNYYIEIRYQDSGFERNSEGYKYLSRAIDEACKLIGGPLGSSSMYIITQNGKIAVTNGELFDRARRYNYIDWRIYE